MSQRTNQNWLDELRRDRGEEQQRLAYEDLAGYLYVVVYNYLQMRQTNLTVLAHFAPKELAALAQDFVQDTLEKLARDDHALLDQFRGTGRFLSWAAQIARHEAGQELRKSYWTRREPFPEEHPPELEPEEWSPSFTLEALIDHSTPENTAILDQVVAVLQRCLDKLQERRRLAFWGCIAEGRSAGFVTTALNTTDNAVHILVYRAKRDLRKCLRGTGLDQTILRIFIP